MAEPHEFTDVRLKPETAALVGELIVAWASVETSFANLLHELVLGHAVPHDQEFNSIVAFLGQPPQVSMGLLKTMTAIRLGQRDGKRFADTLDKIETIKRIRDRLAHSHVEQHPKGSGVQVIEIKTVGRVKINRIPYSDDDLFQHRVNLMKHWQTLLEILVPHGYLKHMYASFEKQRQQAAPPSNPKE